MEYIDLSLLDKNDIKFKIDLPNYGIEDGYVLLNRQFWYREDNRQYFIKIALLNNSGECYNELSAFHMARLFGLSCVEYEVLPIIVNGQLTRASRCRSFLDKYEHTVSLYELTYGLNIDFRNLTKETLNEVCTYVSIKTNIAKIDIYNYFLGIALFDYLTANNDRHLSNISFIKGLDGYRLAPIYDNGCSFITCATDVNIANLTDGIIKEKIKYKDLHSDSIFKDISIFGKVAITNLVNEWLERTNNLKDLYELKDTKIDANHLRLVEYRFKEILGK